MDRRVGTGTRGWWDRGKSAEQPIGRKVNQKSVDDGVVVGDAGLTPIIRRLEVKGDRARPGIGEERIGEAKAG